MKKAKTTSVVTRYYITPVGVAESKKMDGYTSVSPMRRISINNIIEVLEKTDA